MIYREEEFVTRESFPQLLKGYFEGLRVGTFDIETTGLNPEYSAFILGGIGVPASDGCGACGTFPEGCVKVCQYFAEGLGDEENALIETLEELSRLDAVVTYNGDRFDMPFMERRMKEYGLDAVYELPQSLDIYRIINRFSELRKALPNLKQKTVENYFGLWESRTDEIDGAESIERYFSYLASGNEEDLERILLHNADDIRQLTNLVPIVKKADVHRAMSNLGFPAGEFKVSQLKVCSGRLIAEGRQIRNPRSYYSYESGENGYELACDISGRSFSLAVPLKKAGDITVADIEKTPLAGICEDSVPQTIAPYTEDGFIILRNGNTWNYGAVNHFVRLLLIKIQEDI